MSAHKNKASLLGVFIILATAYISVVSAQTPAVNSSTAMPESIRDTKGAVVERKALASKKGSDSSNGPEVGEIRPRKENSDSVKADGDLTEPVETSNEELVRTVPSATSNPQTSSSDEWQFQFSPYFWLAGLHGTGGVGNRTTEVDESFR